jgi:hypothetical protein
MNRYRVAMSVTNVEDFYHVAEAVDDETARRFAKEAAEREHPNAFDVKVEYTELLPPEQEAKPGVTPDLMAHMLKAASLGLMIINPKPTAYLSAAGVMAMKHAQVAAAFDDLTKARQIIEGLLDAADCGAQELESLAIDALSDPEDQPGSDEDAFRQTRELRADYDRRSTEAWQAIEAARAFLATKEPTT